MDFTTASLAERGLIYHRPIIYHRKRQTSFPPPRQLHVSGKTFGRVVASPVCFSSTEGEGERGGGILSIQGRRRVGTWRETMRRTMSRVSTMLSSKSLRAACQNPSGLSCVALPIFVLVISLPSPCTLYTFDVIFDVGWCIARVHYLTRAPLSTGIFPFFAFFPSLFFLRAKTTTPLNRFD